MGERVFDVAVVQAAPVSFDQRATIEKLQDLAADAARTGARLMLFPEAFVSAYPRGTTFGTVIGSRTPEGRDWFRRYWESAMTVPGPVCEQIGRAARAAKAYLVVGVIERDGGTLYCTALFFGPDGAMLGKHRKLMPTAGERLVWGQGDGSTLPVFETAIGRLGAVICWENYMPLLRTAMYAKGIELYCAPTADGRESWIATMRHVALEGRCFVLSCNQFSRRSDYPVDYPIAVDDPDAVLSPGGSCVVGPLGQLLVGPNFDGEAILTATIDLDEIPRAHFDFDAVGHYARPDVFRLDVDERPKPPVSGVSPAIAVESTEAEIVVPVAGASSLAGRG